jgi:hypothetical protein
MPSPSGVPSAGTPGRRPAEPGRGQRQGDRRTVIGWLRVVTANQPVTQAVDILRALLLNQPLGSHLWLTLTEFGGIVALTFTLATVMFSRTASV